MTVAAPAICRGAGERQEGDAALVIHRDHVPDVDAGAVLRAARRPGVVTELALARHGVEGPDQLPGAHIPGALVTRHTARLFRIGSASHYQIAINAGG